MRAAATIALTAVLAACGSPAHRTTTAAAPGAAPRPRPPRAARPLVLPPLLPRRTIAVPILMYHRVDALHPWLPAITARLTVDPRQFAAEMEWLRRGGFHAVSELQLYDALERGRPLPPHPVVITFDDGYRDVLGKAAPVLRRLGMPATAFVITDRISAGDPSFLTWRDLRLLERDGFDIGSHTVTHADLPALAPAQIDWQLVHSRDVLQERLGRPVQWLAYPAGRFDAQVVDIARRAGYVLGMTTRPGTVQSAAAPLELHRYEVLDTTGVAGIAALVGG